MITTLQNQLGSKGENSLNHFFPLSQKSLQLASADDSEQERNGNQGMEVELKFLLMESLGFVAGSVEMTMTSGIVRQH